MSFENAKKRKVGNVSQDILTKMVTTPYLKLLLWNEFTNQDWLMLRFVCRTFAEEIPMVLLEPLQHEFLQYCSVLPPLIISSIVNSHISLSWWLIERFHCANHLQILQILCKTGEKNDSIEKEHENKLYDWISQELTTTNRMELIIVEQMMLDCCRSGNKTLFDKMYTNLIYSSTFCDEVIDPLSRLQNETDFCNAAAAYGHFSMLKYLLELKFKWISADSAAMSGKPEILRFAILEKQLFIRENTISSALDFGVAEDWLIELTPKQLWSSASVSFSLGNSGRLDLCHKIMKDCYPVIEEMVYGACEGGHLNIVEILYPLSALSVNRMFSHAVRGAHLKVMEWCFSKDAYTVDLSSLLVAASNGCLNILKWIHCFMPLAMHQSILMAAVEGRKLNVVKWLVEDLKWRFPDQSDIVGTAKDNGDLAMLAYAIEKGRSMDSLTAKYLLQDKGYRTLHRSIKRIVNL